MENRRRRKVIFVACEGESEQSFVRWLQHLADTNEPNLSVSLQARIPKGGGYEVRLKSAIEEKQKLGSKIKDAFLLVDTDRSDKKDDNWTIEKLRSQAKKSGFTVCAQQPDLEGFYSCMLGKQPSSKPWSGYKKPTPAETLRKKFSLADILRVAKNIPELKFFLETIGFDLNSKL